MEVDRELLKADYWMTILVRKGERERKKEREGVLIGVLEELETLIYISRHRVTSRKLMTE